MCGHSLRVLSLVLSLAALSSWAGCSNAPDQIAAKPGGAGGASSGAGGATGGKGGATAGGGGTAGRDAPGSAGAGAGAEADQADGGTDDAGSAP